MDRVISEDKGDLKRTLMITVRDQQNNTEIHFKVMPSTTFNKVSLPSMHVTDNNLKMSQCRCLMLIARRKLCPLTA